MNTDRMKTVEMKRQKKKAVTVSFRCPEDLFLRLTERIKEEDTDFSKLMRRAIKREMQSAA